MKNITNYVIYDLANDLYIMCWTEGNTIFLTSDFDKIETYKTRQRATEMIENIKSSNCIFLLNDNQAEILKPDLVAGQLIFQTKFVPFDN